MAIIDWTMAQGTPEWYSKRAGIPTASMFASVMTPKKMELAEGRKKYAARLISERLLNWQADNLDKIEHVAAGKENEPFAVGTLEDVYQIETLPVGFIRTNDGRFGASPDRVANVNADKTSVGLVIECKCPTIPIQMERLIFGQEDAYKCQVQGQIWIAEADKAIFFSWAPRMPAYRVEAGRDEPFIKKLVDCLERFSDELEEWTLKVAGMGAFQAFPAIATPFDIELANKLFDEAGIADAMIATAHAAHPPAAAADADTERTGMEV